MNYNELRNALKELRSNGHTLTVKLSGKGITKEVLQAEYDRLTTAIAPVAPVAPLTPVAPLAPVAPVTPHSFKAMVKTNHPHPKPLGFIVKNHHVAVTIYLSDWYSDNSYHVA